MKHKKTMADWIRGFAAQGMTQEEILGMLGTTRFQIINALNREISGWTGLAHLPGCEKCGAKPYAQYPSLAGAGRRCGACGAHYRSWVGEAGARLLRDRYDTHGVGPNGLPGRKPSKLRCHTCGAVPCHQRLSVVGEPLNVKGRRCADCGAPGAKWNIKPPVSKQVVCEGTEPEPKVDSPANAARRAELWEVIKRSNERRAAEKARWKSRSAPAAAVVLEQQPVVAAEPKSAVVAEPKPLIKLGRPLSPTTCVHCGAARAHQAPLKIGLPSKATRCGSCGATRSTWKRTPAEGLTPAPAPVPRAPVVREVPKFLPIVAPVPDHFPSTRGECIDGPRPCPWKLCRYHLASDVSKRGEVRLLKPEDLPGETCALDMVDRNPDGVTLNVVGDLLGITRERVRQVEEMAFRKLRSELGADGLARLLTQRAEVG